MGDDQAHVRRAVSMVQRIPAGSTIYHATLLHQLQLKTMQYISEVNLQTRTKYLLPEFMADVQQFLQRSANLTASLDYVTSGVAIAAGFATPILDPPQE